MLMILDADLTVPPEACHASISIGRCFYAGFYARLEFRVVETVENVLSRWNKQLVVFAQIVLRRCY